MRSLTLTLACLLALTACGGGPTRPTPTPTPPPPVITPPPAPVPAPTPPPVQAWVQSGTGAQVFDMPRTVTRVRIFGDYSGRCENFIIHIAGRGVVNEILGTCSVAIGPHFDGTFVTTGGVVEVLNSVGISWTLVQVG